MGHPTHAGEDYPYRDSTGKPFLPITLYHAEKTGFLWDSYNGSQMVYGSLTCGVLYSMWVHLVRDACWSQKYVAGLSVAGLNQLDQNEIARRSSIATDPSSILVFTQDPDAQGQPLVGSFSIPTDPHALLESISKYEMRVGLAAGLSPADISRSSNGDPRSGKHKRNSLQCSEWAMKIYWLKQRCYQTDSLEPIFQKQDIGFLIIQCH
jgi:hypothetical protein